MTRNEFDKYAHALGFAIGTLSVSSRENVKPIVDNLTELFVFISGLELKDD